MARDFCPMFQLYGVFFYATIINNFNLFNLPSTLLRLTYVFLIAHSLLSIIIIFFYVGSPPRGDHNVHDQPTKQYKPFCCLNTLTGLAYS